MTPLLEAASGQVYQDVTGRRWAHLGRAQRDAWESAVLNGIMLYLAGLPESRTPEHPEDAARRRRDRIRKRAQRARERAGSAVGAAVSGSGY